MTFEKALEAMKQGKETMREYWMHNSGAVIGIDTDNNGKKRLYIRHLDDPCNEKHYCHFGSTDALANDWVIHEPEKKIKPDVFKNVGIVPSEALIMTYEEWKRVYNPEKHNIRKKRKPQCTPISKSHSNPAKPLHTARANGTIIPMMGSRSL
ncbi:MAG: DUF2829 domain-containing protein [Oscillospiraceae bacterium]|nr:DUF2829 domain-containing protein [Oscillospiraceae bacterium]